MTNATLRQHPLAGKRVLITGARGFLGTHLRRALATSGSEVHGVVRQLPADDFLDAGIRWWKADASDAAAVDNVISTVKPDIIFQLTSHAWGAPDLDRVLPTLQDDLVATVNVMTSAARAGVRRVITTGSMQEPSLIDGKCTPCSPYAAAKWAGAAYARMFVEVFALPVVVVRPFMVYGPGQASEKIIPYIIQSFMAGESPRIGHGSQQVDWIYVDDVIGGLIKAAHIPEIEGRTVELGSGRTVPLAVVADEIAALVPNARAPEFGAYVRPREALRVADAETTWQLLGWRAETPMREGLSRTVAYWRTVKSRGVALRGLSLAGSAKLIWLGQFAEEASRTLSWI